MDTNVAILTPSVITDMDCLQAQQTSSVYISLTSFNTMIIYLIPFISEPNYVEKVPECLGMSDDMLPVWNLLSCFFA